MNGNKTFSICNIERYLRSRNRALGGPDNKFRVNVQGSFYGTIRYAYTYYDNQEGVHALVLKHLKKRITDSATAVLSCDGGACEEKFATHQKWLEVRVKATKNVTTFSDCVISGARTRKRHFSNVDKELKNAFRWDIEAQWIIVESDMEADVMIAMDYTEGDIVVSEDSDLLVYSRITVSWRSQPGSHFLEY
ncbi:hypothetical protein BGZ59_004356 [Podila verticillata]|nr:hypothetical protein BGZ59_004356 [Podila verticillata]